MIDLKLRAVEAAERLFQSECLAHNDGPIASQNCVSCIAAAMLEFADAALAEKDAEIAKLREQVEALRELYEHRTNCLDCSDLRYCPTVAKARACGAL